MVPAGTRPHKGPSVLLREWESTTVPMFVTSSYGRILQQAAGSGGPAASHQNTCICLTGCSFGFVALMPSASHRVREF